MKLFFLAQAATFGIAAAFFAKRWIASASDTEQKIIISHEPYSLFFLSLFFRPFPSVFVAFDLHVGAKQNFFWRRACKIATHFFALTRGVAETLKTFKAQAQIFISPDAVDLELFGRDCGKQNARKTLGLPHGAFICVYAGHLYPWKGVDTLLGAAQFLPQDVIIYCAGGTDAEITNYKLQIAKRGLRNIIMAGRRPHKEIPQWLCAADALLLPNSGKEAISRLYTSPMKMFEYMASGKPIVASRLPSIGEVLNGSNALLVEADNPKDFAGGILCIKNNPIFGSRIAVQAKKDIVKYSWEEKAKCILRAFNI